MKYDDASWHYGGEFPQELPEEAGATHIGMFVAWALLAGLSGSTHVDDFPDDIPRLRARTVTPGQFILASCDGKFIDEDLNEQGNAFAQAYYDLEKGIFFADYERVAAPDLPTLYHVPDSWETFDKLKPVFDRRLAEFIQ
jgi:hypothetical protein